MDRALNTATIPTSKHRKISRKITYSLAILNLFTIALSVSMTSILPSLIACSLLIQAEYRKYWQILKAHPLFWLSILLFTCVVIGGLWSPAPAAGIWRQCHKYSKVFYIPIMILALHGRPQATRHGLNAFLLGLSIMLTMSYLKFFHLMPFWPKPADSIIFNHLDSSFLISIAAYCFAQRACQEQKHRYIYIALTLLCSYQMFFINHGRTGYITYLLLAALLAYQRIHNKKLLLMAITLLPLSVIALYYISPAVHFMLKYSYQSITNFQQNKQTSIGFRLQFIQFSWHLIQQAPWFGHGSGSFNYFYNKIGQKFIPGLQFNLLDPHNDLLLFTVQFGLMGFIIWWSFFLTTLGLTGKLEKNQKITQGIILAFIAACFCDSMLHLTVCGSFYCLMIGMLFSQYKTNSKQNPHTTDIETKNA